MQRLQALISPRMSTFLLGTCALAFIISMILFPDQAFKASLQGIQLWWKLVFPALLPFLIVTEIMRGTGALHGVGALLEPLLRVLFRLPGIGGWLMAMGYTAGTPVSAAAISTLRGNGEIGRDEAERLLAATHALSPVFLITVVGVGFLHSATAGLALALIHYGSLLLLLLVQRMLVSDTPVLRPVAYRNGLFRYAGDVYREAGRRDGRAFGKLLGDAVSMSVQQCFMIGGYIMMFSVLLQVLSLSGLVSALASALSLFGVSSQVISALLSGFFEMHLGAYALSQPGIAPDIWPYALLSLVLAWGGLSALVQVRSLTAGTDLRFGQFLRFRLLHAASAFVVTLIAWKPLNAWLTRKAEPLSAAFLGGQTGFQVDHSSLWPLVSPMMLQVGTILLLLVVVSIFTAFLFYRGQR